MSNTLTKYKKEYDHQIYIAARSGMRVADIADLFKVDTQTIYNWFEKHKKFHKAYKKGREESQLKEVRNSLLNRAKGFYYTEVESRPDRNGNMKPVKQVRKYCPPSEAALFFFLTNRDPENWKHRNELTLGQGKGSFNIVVKHEEPADQGNN